MSAVDSDRIAVSALLGRGLPPQLTDGDLLERIDALAERVDRLIARLAGDSPTDAVSPPQRYQSTAGRSTRTDRARNPSNQQ